VQQKHAEVLFKKGNLPRDRRLADVALAGDGRKRARFRHTDQSVLGAYDVY
jgi:hypothetical protein